MIKKILIKNIQSHKDSELEFDKGINCIVGSSNQGKTSIIRAINWVVCNRPLGCDILLSDFAKDDDMYVKLQTDNHSVVRVRNKTKNQYIVDGVEYNAVKTEVPDEVTKALRLNDLNIQNQQDTPFLLSASSSDISKILNKTVNLNIIDKIFNQVDSDKKSLKYSAKNITEQINETEIRLKSYSIIEEIECFFDEYEKINKKYAVITSMIESIKNKISEYLPIKNKLNYYKGIIDLKTDEFDEELKNNESIVRSIQRIEVDIKKVSECKTYNFENQKEEICNFESRLEKFNAVDVEKIRNNVFRYKENMYEKKESECEIIELKNKLPKVCPLCGGVLK